MEQNYQSTKLPTVGAAVAASGAGVNWLNPSRITADDGSTSTVGYFSGGDNGATIRGSSFGFQQLPDQAVIDGIQVYIDGLNVGCYGTVSINAAGSTGKAIGAFGNYGGSTDLWGLSQITAAQIAALTVSVSTGDVSGGDGYAEIDFMQVTVYWHIEIPSAPANVPTRVAYKAYTSDERYLGELPKVTSKFGFPQDMNSAGSSIEITCGVKAENRLETEPIITGDGLDIITGDGNPLVATIGDVIFAQGSDPEDAIFKNGNRIRVWLYNQWHPNGKLMFSGQVNKVKPKYAGAKSYTKLMVLSDGLDLNNLVARGYPFNYTDEVVQTTYNDLATATMSGGGGGWHTYGQTFKTDADQTNIGAISLLFEWYGDCTISVYDGPNGNLLGSTTKFVNHGTPTEEVFEFPNLIPVNPSSTYFFAIWLGSGNSLRFAYNTSSVYVDGGMYDSSYSGGSGGGSFAQISADLWFKIKSGVPTTTTTYATADPVTGMMSPILADYNARGGKIRQRDFTPAGYTLTYIFNMAFIYDAMKKVLEMSPSGYYAYIDLGTSEMDILEMSETADFTVVNDRDVIDLDLELSIEQIKNYLLLTGGEVTPGVNLYRDYVDSESISNYGIRTAPKSDNRMTQTTTADAVGDSFIEENSDEQQQTSLVVPVTAMDHTLLVPGKTIGFRNYGNFIDRLVLPIVRREFNTGFVVLTLGRLPIRMNDEVQRIQRELLNEQTANNPTSPS